MNPGPYPLWQAFTDWAIFPVYFKHFIYDFSLTFNLGGKKVLSLLSKWENSRQIGFSAWPSWSLYSTDSQVDAQNSNSLPENLPHSFVRTNFNRGSSVTRDLSRTSLSKTVPHHHVKSCRGACSPRVLVQLGSICYSFLKTNGILMQCSVEKSKIMWTQACFPHWTWLSPPAAASGAFLKSLFYTLSWWRVSKAIAVTSSDPQRNCDTRNGDWNNSSFSCSPRQALRKDSHILSLYV